MMAISKKNLGHLGQIRFIEKGLFSRIGSVRFDTEAGSASRISNFGTSEIQVTTLDQEISDPISFIKLDVEGAEFDAINGAANHIQSDAPRIAACVYHNQNDFWRIPKRILELDSRYQVYLRHYTEGILETVAFSAIRTCHKIS